MLPVLTFLGAYIDLKLKWHYYYFLVFTTCQECGNDCYIWKMLVLAVDVAPFTKYSGWYMFSTCNVASLLGDALVTRERFCNNLQSEILHILLHANTRISVNNLLKLNDVIEVNVATFTYISLNNLFLSFFSHFFGRYFLVMFQNNRICLPDDRPTFLKSNSRAIMSTYVISEIHISLRCRLNYVCIYQNWWIISISNFTIFSVNKQWSRHWVRFKSFLISVCLQMYTIPS